jgi:hypothetical protein
VEVLLDLQHRLCLHRLYRHLRHLVLLGQELLYQPVPEHRVHHGQEVREHLVRLFRGEQVHRQDLLVRHVLVVPQEVQKVVLCLADRQELLFREDQQEGQLERLYQEDQLEDRVRGDPSVRHDQ